MRLDGKCALVTGGSRGIGRSIAVALAEFGADVAVSCEANVEAAEAVAAGIRALGPRAAVVKASLGDSYGPRQTFDGAIATLGRVDVLVLNASLQMPIPWQQITPAQFDIQMRINIRASMELMQWVVPSMQERTRGRIITVGSVQEVLLSFFSSSNKSTFSSLNPSAAARICSASEKVQHGRYQAKDIAQLCGTPFQQS